MEGEGNAAYFDIAYPTEVLPPTGDVTLQVLVLHVTIACGGQPINDSCGLGDSDRSARDTLTFPRAVVHDATYGCAVHVWTFLNVLGEI